MPLAALSPSAAVSTSALEESLVLARRVHTAWQTYGALPYRVVRFRAHVNRITSLKFVPGFGNDYWLITGSVDGYVRVWDVHRALRQTGAMNVSSEMDAEAAVHSQDEEDEALLRPIDPATEIRRSARACLVAEVDTGADVTSIDAQLDASTRTMRIAVGSYYNSSACLLYELHLDTMPRVMDFRASLDPPEWCGTQCVSLLHDTVAIGTYTGRVYLLHWLTGERCVLEHMERASIAALKLLETHLLSITRTGSAHVYKRTGATHAALVAQHTISQRPVLSISCGEPCAQRAGALVAEHAPLAFVCLDPLGLTHWTWNGTSDAPLKLRHMDLLHERLISTSIGAQGKYGIVTSSLGGVPPMCTARAYTQGRSLCAIRPTPDMLLPEAVAHARSVAGSPAPSTSQSQSQSRSRSTSPVPPTTPLSASPTTLAHAPPRPRVRVDSFSSTSTTSSAAPTPSSRIDMLTECALDETRGLVCLASVRGAIWISDYGNSLHTM